MIYQCEECNKKYDSTEVKPFRVVPTLNSDKIQKALKEDKPYVLMCEGCLKSVIKHMRKASSQIIPGSRLGV